MVDPAHDSDSPSRHRTNGHRAGDHQLEDRIRKLEAALEQPPEPVTSEEAIAERVLVKLANMAQGPRQLTGGNTATPDGAVVLPPSQELALKSWFPTQVWSSVRLAARMYFDPRYRVSRVAQLLLPVVLLLFAVNYVVFSIWLAVPIVSPVLERIGCVILGVIAYHIVSREVTRYRQVLDYLAKYGR